MSIVSAIEEEMAKISTSLGAIRQHVAKAPAPAAPAAKTAAPAPTTASSATLTASEFSDGLQAAQTILTALATKSATLSTAEVAAEDIAGLLADFNVPGAAVADQIITDAPTLILQAQALLPLLSEGLVLFGSGTAAPEKSPIGGDPSFSRGR